MGLISEALFAFRGRRFTEWLMMDRPQIPIIGAVAFYTLVYCQYKYDLLARLKGQPTYNDYSYVKLAAEHERARLAALSSSPTPNELPVQTPSKTTSSSSAGAN